MIPFASSLHAHKALAIVLDTMKDPQSLKDV